ncbi:MAG: hypothetical protein ACR2GM_09120 [Nocardioidaceae bacterium]
MTSTIAVMPHDHAHRPDDDEQRNPGGAHAEVPEQLHRVRQAGAEDDVADKGAGPVTGDQAPQQRPGQHQAECHVPGEDQHIEQADPPWR